MIPSQADVVVIGSGPSGSMAAGLLAKDGFDVVVMDRKSHPRMTVGENVIPDFWKYTDMLGASDDIRAAGFVRKAGGRVQWNGQTSRMQFSDFGYERPAIHADREEFDHILIKHAQRHGAALFENVTVRRVDFDGDFQKVIYDDGDGMKSIHARYVVDASGQGGLLSRQMNTRVTNPDFRFMSVWGYFQDSLYYDYDGNIHPHARVQEVPPMTFQTSLALADHVGWSWHIPLRETTSVGFVLQREVIAGLKRDFDTWEERFDHVVKSEPALHELMKDAKLREDGFYFINDFSGHSTQLSGPGYFTAGDAAGFFDPIFSIGVTLGLYTGSLAAWAVGECLRKPQNAARYQELFKQQVLARIEIARGLALPSYASAPLDEERASRNMKFTSNSSKELLQAAAGLSERGSNLDRLLAPR